MIQKLNYIASLSGWWLVYPSEKYDFVNWDDDIPNIWENKIDVPNHQPGSILNYIASLLRFNQPDTSRWLKLSPAPEKLNSGQTWSNMATTASWAAVMSSQQWIPHIKKRGIFQLPVFFQFWAGFHMLKHRMIPQFSSMKSHQNRTRRTVRFLASCHD